MIVLNEAVAKCFVNRLPSKRRRGAWQGTERALQALAFLLPQPREMPSGPVPSGHKVGLGNAALPKIVTVHLVWLWVGLAETCRGKADSKPVFYLIFKVCCADRPIF